MKKPHEIFLDKVMSRRRFGIKPGLETISRLMEFLGHPERDLKFIHIAGTNGKGATCAITEAVLHAAGYKTGRYTSPHLVSINERFSIDTRPVSDELLATAANKVIPAIEKLESELKIETTFFECLTAIAFVLFKTANVDMVVLETGLGGTYDATNIIPPESLLCAAITRIGLDHCDWLGNTLSEIAKEKAGIVKDRRPLVLGKLEDEAKDAILSVAKTKNAPVVFAPRETGVPGYFALQGDFQKDNARTALAILDVLKISYGISIPDDAIKTGLSSVVWPGRCQHVTRNGHLFIVDGAHNPDAAIALKNAVKDVKRPIAMIAGFCGDKDAAGHLKEMSEIVSRGWGVAIRNERALNADAVASGMNDANIPAEPAVNLSDAIANAHSWAEETEGATIICGSLFLAAEALQELDAFPWKSNRLDPNEKTRAS